MNTDVFFTMGHSHKVCEDYAEKGESYVIVSDGCSSAPNTDFGSRILVRTGAQHLGAFDHKRTEIFGSRVVASAATMCQSLGMKLETIRATLLVARIDQDRKTFSWGVYGDGVVVRKHRKLGLQINVYSQRGPTPEKSNAPPYPAYCLSRESWESYKQEFGLELVTNTYTVGETGFIESEFVTSFDHLEPYHPVCIAEQNLVEDYEWIALFSDGPEQFCVSVGDTNQLKKIPIIDVILPFLAFKGMQGEFVQRRAKRAMKEIEERVWDFGKEGTGQGAKPFDDFSQGVLCF